MNIKFTNITKTYGRKRAVSDVNITLSNGVCALLGANGSGKTTLMRMLADVLRPTEGKISLDGRDIRLLDAAYRNVIGYLPQNFGYYKDFTAYDFLLYMCALKGIDGSFAKERSAEQLEYVGLAEHRDKKLRTFSGGMCRRIGVAQALLNDPSILILDEPTAGLDPKERIRFRNMMCEASEHKLIVYATHIVSDISFIADRVLIMKDGEIIADGTPADLLASMRGKVWTAQVTHGELDELKGKFTIGSVCALESGLLRSRIIADDAPCPGASAAEPELDDVYLSYFGEVEKHGDNS